MMQYDTYINDAAGNALASYGPRALARDPKEDNDSDQ